MNTKTEEPETTTGSMSISLNDPTKPPTRKELAELVGKMISSERNETHGEPGPQFAASQRIKSSLRWDNMPNWNQMHQTHKESIELIATKLSRIVNGNSSHIDHWLDIAGYALIAAEACNDS